MSVQYADGTKGQSFEENCWGWGGGGALENERKGWAKYERFKISEKPLCRKVYIF